MVSDVWLQSAKKVAIILGTVHLAFTIMDSWMIEEEKEKTYLETLRIYIYVWFRVVLLFIGNFLRQSSAHTWGLRTLR